MQPYMIDLRYEHLEFSTKIVRLAFRWLDDLGSKKH